MPPKAEVKKNAEKEKKAQQKAQSEKRSQAAADKTFGLKNKNKSKVVQQYVKNVTQGANQVDARAAALAKKAKEEKEKAKAAAKEAELSELFAVAIKQPKLEAGVDPKSVLCEFFRAGKCQKGFKCKYSHDWGVERKSQKIDLFSDRRDAEEEGMEDWDQAKLEAAIAQKHSAENKNRPTEIICKFFLDAIEKKQYGWFWNCPNGKECKYRHGLPPGYVMKSQMQALLAEQKANMPTTEELLEDKRKSLKAQTPVTEEVFMEWKRKQKEKKMKAADALKDKNRREDKISGRDLFESGNMVVVDDENAHDEYAREESVEQQEAKANAEAAANQAAAKANQGQGEDLSHLEELNEEDFEGMDDLDESELAELEAGLQDASVA